MRICNNHFFPTISAVKAARFLLSTLRPLGMLPIQIFTALRAELRPHIIFFRDAYLFSAMLARKYPKRRFMRIRNNHSSSKSTAAVTICISTTFGAAIFLTDLAWKKTWHRTPDICGIPVSTTKCAFPFLPLLTSSFTETILQEFKKVLFILPNSIKEKTGAMSRLFLNRLTSIRNPSASE